MNTHLARKTLMVLVIATLVMLVIIPSVTAQEEMEGSARARVGYFAFDPRDYDTYMDGEVFPFANNCINFGWSLRCYSVRCVTASPFFDFSDGIHSFAIAAKGGSLEDAVLEPREVAFEDGHAYSLAIVGSLEAGDLDVLVIDDTQLLGEADPETTFVGILVNNITGLPAFDVQSVTSSELVERGQYWSLLAPADRRIFYTVFTAEVDPREHLFSMASLPVPAHVSDLGAMYGSYPGTYDEDYFLGVNWGYSGEITIVDVGAIEVGSEITGEVAEVGHRVRYTLNLAETTALNIYANGTGRRYDDTIMLGITTFDPAVYIFDDAGKLLDWHDDTVFISAVDARLEGITLEAGTYRVEVGGSFDLVSGPFELIVEAAGES